VRFGRLNLMDGHIDGGDYDMILCRNVLICLSHANRVRRPQPLPHLARRFFISHAKTLAGM
jgi:chemotaxis methyl-accepting protein methylase